MRNKIDVVVYKWQSTEGNHAGMYYFGQQIIKQISDCEIYEEYRYEKWIHGFLRKIKKIIWAFIFLLKRVFIRKSSNRIIFFTEFFGNSWQMYLAAILRRLHPHLKIYSIIHLPYNILVDVHKSKSKIAKYTNYCDKIFVFGSSLKRDLIDGGCQAEIVLSHHYVDVNYYKPDSSVRFQTPITIIIMGDLLRDKELIVEVLKLLSEFELKVIYCAGRSGIPYSVTQFKNVECYNYLSESDLLNLMQRSDISLNIFSDTIGSNVIVTSMAVGLAIVASDVGSIKDYCDDENAILCKNNAASFVNAIIELCNNKELLQLKKEASLKRAKQFSLKNSISKLFQESRNRI